MNPKTSPKIVQIVAADSSYGWAHFAGDFVPMKVLVWGLDESGQIHGFISDGAQKLVRVDASAGFNHLAQGA